MLRVSCTYRKMHGAIRVDEPLVRTLLREQFPQYAELGVRPVDSSGWDNHSFRLGETLVARLPSAQIYESQVAKEQFWLPKLAQHLSVDIPRPVGLGSPGNGFPFAWSIYAWIEGETAASRRDSLPASFGKDLAAFLKSLMAIKTDGAPVPDAENFYRGASPAVYDRDVRRAIMRLNDRAVAARATMIWERGRLSEWTSAPVWLHGDFSAGNILIRQGRLAGVIDFGQLAVGDPACDLAIAWTLLDDDNRRIFRETLDVDGDTWRRGRCWALWKALLLRTGLSESNEVELASAERTLGVLIEDAEE